MSAKNMQPMQYLEFIEAWLTTISLICLTVYHTKSTHTRFISHHNQKFTISSLTCWSFTVLFFSISFGLFGIINGLYLYFLVGMNFIYCHVLVYSISVLYGGFKLMSYVALVLRLRESYKGSMISYSTRFYYIWLAFIIIYGLSIVFMGIFAVDFYWISEINKCKSNIPIYVIGGMILGDFLICSVNLYLFLRPLCILSKMSKSMDNSLKVLIRKNAILASISMITTIIAWLIIAATGGKFVYIYQMMDCTITSFCITLLIKWNKRLFDFLCCAVSKWVNGDTLMDRMECAVQIDIDMSTSNVGDVTATSNNMSSKDIVASSSDMSL